MSVHSRTLVTLTIEVAEGDSRTQAEESLQWLTVDRRRQLEEWRRSAARSPRLRSRLDVMVREADDRDHMTVALRELFAVLVPHLVEQCPEAESRVASLSISGLLDEDVVAALTTFPDDSGRVLVSDGMFSMLTLLADLSAVWYYGVGNGRGWVRALRVARAITRLDRDARLVPVLTVALRWHLLHRRVWGKGATLALEPTGDEVPLKELQVQTALMFVVAHECAHYLLGHTTSDIGRWETEHEADVLALKAVHGYLHRGRLSLPWTHSLTGARLAIMAAQLVESSLFVRPPITHPSAAARWEALVTHAGDANAGPGSLTATAGLHAAVCNAYDLRFEMPRDWWGVAYAHPRVHCDVHEPEYYEHLWILDRISFGDPDDAASMLDGLARDRGVDGLTAALAARDAGLASGLRKLGVDDATVKASSSRDIAMSFRSLTEVVHDSPALAMAPDSTTRRLAAVATATLMGGVEKGVL